MDIFNQKITDTLPQHHGPEIDHKIILEIIDRKLIKPPWGLLYDISRSKLLVLQRMLTELLNKDFIHISNSSVGASVLFEKKLNEGLQFYVDYHILNKLTKKN